MCQLRLSSNPYLIWGWAYPVTVFSVQWPQGIVSILHALPISTAFSAVILGITITSDLPSVRYVTWHIFSHNVLLFHTELIASLSRGARLFVHQRTDNRSEYHKIGDNQCQESANSTIAQVSLTHCIFHCHSRICRCPYVLLNMWLQMKVQDKLWSEAGVPFQHLSVDTCLHGKPSTHKLQ